MTKEQIQKRVDKLVNDFEDAVSKMFKAGSYQELRIAMMDYEGCKFNLKNALLDGYDSIAKIIVDGKVFECTGK